MRPKKKPAASYSPPQPPPRERYNPREEWPKPTLASYSMWDAARPTTIGLRALLHDSVYRLPPWQRGQVWTPAQQVALCETIWNGLPLAPLLLWVRRVGPNISDVAVVVLDGQQRLCALGADVRRHDGTPCTPTAAHLDLETGRWQVGPSEGHPPVTMREVCDMGWLFDRMWAGEGAGDDRTVDLAGMAIKRTELWTGCVYAMGPSVTAEDAIQVFRAWNTPGVPIPQDEIEALIREADLGWSP